MRRLFYVQAVRNTPPLSRSNKFKPVVLQSKFHTPQKCKPPQMISSAAATIYKKQASRICMRGKAFLGTAAAVTSAARPLVFLLIIHHMQKREKRNLSFRRNIKHSLSARVSSRKFKSSPLFRRYR